MMPGKERGEAFAGLVVRGDALGAAGSLPFLDSHFAAGAVEAEGEAAAVVEKEQRAVRPCTLVDGTHPEFITDAVAGAHKFRAFAVGKFVGVLRALVKRAAQGVGEVVEVGGFRGEDFSAR